MRRSRLLPAATVAALLVTGCATATPDGAATAPSATAAADVAEGTVVTVHRTEACGCCGEYEDHLEAAGYVVEQELHTDLAPVKAGFGIPDGEGSCHTNEVAGYAVEGHVPVAAIEQLLTERPDVDGISLAGMPSGSPGMPGEQTEPFVVRTFVDGEVTGELGRF
jgi:hypothetical protein